MQLRKNITLMKFSRRMDTQHLSIRSSSLQVPRNKETETDCDAEEKSPLVLIPYEQVKTSEE